MSRETLVPLPVPVPPMLEQALGYPGQARLVAFYWSPSGDEAVFNDGRHAGDGDWVAYLAFVEHPSVEPHLRPFDLGSSQEEAQHWLVLDREARMLSVLLVEEAALRLQQHWGSQPVGPRRLEVLDPIPPVLAAVTGRQAGVWCGGMVLPWCSGGRSRGRGGRSCWPGWTSRKELREHPTNDLMTVRAGVFMLPLLAK